MKKKCSDHSRRRAVLESDPLAYTGSNSFAMCRNLIAGTTLLVALHLIPSFALAHHSFAMYDNDKVYVMTGIVTRVDPNPNHLQVFIAPLNQQRDQVFYNSDGEPIVWAIEMRTAAQEARQGVSVNGLPRGTIVSVGLYPLRNGFPGGGRGEFGFFKCPDDTPPAPGNHCDEVTGSTSLGMGELPQPTHEMPETPREE